MEQKFDSIERMMELGMSMAVAQQMMNTMNSCFQNTVIPQVGIPAPQMPRMKDGYYLVVDNNVAGPLSDEEVSLLISQGKVNEQTLCWKHGMSGWCQLPSVPELYKLLLLGKQCN